MASASVPATSFYSGEADRITYQDMVDTIPFNLAEPSLHADVIVKIVLGSLNSMLDNGKIRPPAVPHY